jgi:hypothetical protein
VLGTEDDAKQCARRAGFPFRHCAKSSRTYVTPPSSPTTFPFTPSVFGTRLIILQCMLSSRGIHGLVERCAPLSWPNVLYANTLYRTVTPRRASSLRFHGAPVQISRLPCQTYALHIAVRLASTSTRPPTTDKDAPPTPLPSRKPKVELRPGPVKPRSTNSPSSPATSPKHEEAVIAKADAAKAHAYTAGKAVEQMSTIETMKFDVKDAMRRGIMASPPAGAGTFGNIWHQMKEVFVRHSHTRCCARTSEY